MGEPAIGHSPVALVERLAQLGLPVSERIRELAARLSKFYTPTRYPDVWESGIPEDYYTGSEAEEAIRWAGEIINWAEAVWKSLSGG